MGHKLPIKEVKRVVKYKAGYEVRTEVISGEDYGSPDVEMRSAYNERDQFIGNPILARRLAHRGIKPELSDPSHSTCSIGFCEKEQKWYGWSHRAIVAFGIGDRIYVERYGNDKTPITKHGPRPITNMREAKLAAKRFARSVS